MYNLKGESLWFSFFCYLIFGTYKSCVSQSDADSQAQRDVDNNKQSYANSHGTCSCPDCAFSFGVTREKKDSNRISLTLSLNCVNKRNCSTFKTHNVRFSMSQCQGMGFTPSGVKVVSTNPLVFDFSITPSMLNSGQGYVLIQSAEVIIMSQYTHLPADSIGISWEVISTSGSGDCPDCTFQCG